MSVRTLLIRGMLVGIVAAGLAFAFASVFGEPQIDGAIAFENAHTHADHVHAGAAEPEPVSRTVQSTAGLGVAVLLYGTALGGIFAMAFAGGYGRVGALGPRATALLVGGLGFVAMFLVPFVKYPANPPAVGEPDTIGRRTALYFVLVGVSVLAAFGSVLVARGLVPRLGGWNAVVAAAGAYVVVVAIAGLLLPAVDEVPADFPATLLWRFRLASAGTQLVLWSTLGLLFGALTDRAERHRAARQAMPVGLARTG
ncbi:CbtA family protein [Dactylosporangium roseum]|uniref:CbtA family protein n=1 Tax=Dactylosporangium roseum TaxID=47989 RepID=A0ABY5Z0F9_9ACTN|nr:CbtA family protein [Dactylosporangium roseum]UWZ34263.1 CbtA family protein [Dactylosporangium roseum]